MPARVEQMLVASTKPSAFTEGDVRGTGRLLRARRASTKPSAFTEGDQRMTKRIDTVDQLQRSPRLSPRVTPPARASRRGPTCFNEALGFHRG